jgi:hypothetical protein
LAKFELKMLILQYAEQKSIKKICSPILSVYLSPFLIRKQPFLNLKMTLHICASYLVYKKLKCFFLWHSLFLLKRQQFLMYLKICRAHNVECLFSPSFIQNKNMLCWLLEVLLHFSKTSNLQQNKLNTQNLIMLGPVAEGMRFATQILHLIFYLVLNVIFKKSRIIVVE